MSFSNALTISRADAREFREEVLALCARNQFDLSSELFDWYYSHNGEGQVVSWLARLDCGRIVGLLSVVPRTFRMDGTLVRAGVLGNLLVDAEHRRTLAAIDLLRASQRLVSQGELDILLGTPNEGPAQQLTLRMGFQIIERWQTFIHILHAYPLLKKRYGWPVALFSPVIDLGFRALGFRSNLGQSKTRSLTINPFSGKERIDPETWADTGRSLTLHASSRFLRERFLLAPHKKYRLLGVGTGDGETCGYIVVQSVFGRLDVCDIRINQCWLSPTQAVVRLCACKDLREQMVSVTTLRNSNLARSLPGYGFIPLPPRFAKSNIALCGSWLSNHPLSRCFAEPCFWNIFPGLNDV